MSERQDADAAEPPAKRSKLPDDAEEFVAPVGGRTFQINIVSHRTMKSGVDKNKQIIKFKVQFVKKFAQDDDSDSSDDSEASDALHVLTTSWLTTDLIGSIDPSVAIRYLESHCPDIADWQKEGFIDELRSRRTELFQLQNWDHVVDFCCHLCSCGERCGTEMIECTGSTLHRKCCHGMIDADEAQLGEWKHSLERANDRATLQMFKMNEDASGNCKSNSTQHQEKILLEKGLKSARSRETKAVNDMTLADPVR